MEKPKILMLIDVQKAFIRGDVHTKIVLNRIHLLLAAKCFDHIILTQFINHEESPFVKILNWHECQTEDDWILEVPKPNYPATIIRKDTYTAFTEQVQEKLKSLNQGTNPSEVYLAGFDTDACILKTAFDLFEANIRPLILGLYCFSSGGEQFHNAGLLCMGRSLGGSNILWDNLHAPRSPGWN